MKEQRNDEIKNLDEKLELVIAKKGAVCSCNPGTYCIAHGILNGMEQEPLEVRT